jgi:hypothetical protein
MSLLNILRQRASCRTSSHLPLSLPRTHHVVSSLARPQWTKSTTLIEPTFKRLASDAAAAARARKSLPTLSKSTLTPPTAVLYPSKINIYRAGTPITIFVGFLRMATLVVFGTGTFVLAPSYLFSPTTSSLWVPLLVLGSAIPALVAVFATGPVIHAIQLHLPLAARRSKSELKRFADYPPADTVLKLTYMRLAPWMTTKEVQFSRLRRTPPTLKGGIANLEYVPEHVVEHKGTIWFWLVQGFWGRYYVKRDQTSDRAAVPGVLNKMWEQIPLKGSKGDPMLRSGQDAAGGRRVVRMSGRPGVMSGRVEASRREVVPPPPTAAGRERRK